MLESKIQSKIIKHLNAHGYIAVKLMKTNLNGIADLIAIKWKTHVFIEVKQESWREEVLQATRRKQFTDQGSDWLVVYGWEDYLKQYESYRNSLKNTT